MTEALCFVKWECCAGTVMLSGYLNHVKLYGGFPDFAEIVVSGRVA